MPRRKRFDKSRRLTRTAAGRWWIEVAIGPLGSGELYGVSDDELVPVVHQAWVLLREEVMREFAARHPGARPWAWWRFERGEDRPFGADEIQRLIDIGEATDEELDRIVADAEARHRDWGPPLRCHGLYPQLRRANVVLRHRGLAEYGFAPETAR